MRVIDTSKTLPSDLSPWEADQVYNGLDCCVTLEVLNVLEPQLDNQTRTTYEFSKSLQGPVLEMGIRGCRVDVRRKAQALDEYFELLEMLERNLERIVLDGVGLSHFNWRSTPDLRRLFYDELGIPPVRKAGKPTVNRDALEKLQAYTVARPIVAHMLAMRDIAKKVSFLKTAIDPDGRIRTSYNIAGTSTGRFSSSVDIFGEGGNLQNVEEILRSIFISDPGMKFVKCDTKTGESYCVGGIEWNIFQDGRYLDACQSGDLHTGTAKACWTNLPWTGDPKADRAIAEQKYYRTKSYRDYAKNTGHGSNYAGTPQTLSDMYKIPVTSVAEFQRAYFKAFPAHQQWHHWVRQTIRKEGFLDTLTGRRRWFFGRRDADDTIREAIAYSPQGTLADVVNTGMLNAWRENLAQLMFQDHDAITFQYPEEIEDEVVPKLQKLLPIRVELLHGREMVIPYDCKTGWNKGNYDPKANPDGLKDFHGHDKRKRTAAVAFLDRRVR